jgi:hypothetical protein
MPVANHNSPITTFPLDLYDWLVSLSLLSADSDRSSAFGPVKESATLRFSFIKGQMDKSGEKDERRSISQLGLDCQKHFILLINALRARADDSEVGSVRLELTNAIAAMSEELGRFRTWANNIGALSDGRGSLGYRVNAAEYVRHSIEALLEDLNESLQDG